jgi:nicotinate-nucleotide adenylyltransferase
VEAPLLDISATFIRNSIKAGKSIRYMVSDVVDEYIRWKKFYL